MKINDILTENRIRNALNYIGIKLPDKIGSNGEVIISSPLRLDENPSFSINLNNCGIWFDHGTDEGGNLIQLISRYLNIDEKSAIKLLVDIIQGKYPRISDYYGTKHARPAVQNHPKKVNTANAKSSVTEKSPEPEYNLQQALERLKQGNSPVIGDVKEYDLLKRETLKRYKCGIITEYGSDWLSIPYETGVQLYRRENGEKDIRMLKGSRPKDSFFGLDQLAGRGTLIISKSPREAMLLKQEFSDYIDVISIASGEAGQLSDLQKNQLNRIIAPFNLLKIVFDCDTDQAHMIAKGFTKDVINTVKEKSAVRYVNVFELTGGACKDCNDLFKKYDNDWIVENVLAQSSRLQETGKVNLSEIISRDLQVEEAPNHPAEAYSLLPKGIREMLELLDEDYKKDVFLNSALPVMASHMTNVCIDHKDGWYSPDYFSLLIAEPGSGKGLADKAKKLGNTLNTHLIHISNQEKAKWESLLNDEKYKKPKPKTVRLFIPGNSSSRAIYDTLAANGGRGIIFETEIDSLVDAASQEWGDYTDLLRKAFHHESISLSRKEFDLDVNRPELSIFMSGTFDQFRKMFPSAENGYFSRFVLYTFTAPVEWQSHRPTKESRTLETLIKKNSDKLFQIHRHLSERENPLRVYLNDHQWNQQDIDFSENMLQIKEENLDGYLHSSNKRLAIIAIRIATIVAVYRAYEKGQGEALKEKHLLITDEDYQVGQLLATNHFNHAVRLYHQLPKVSVDSQSGKRLNQFYELLPDSFQKKEANFMAMNLKFTPRTATNYLKKLEKSGMLTKEQHGEYRKAT